MIALLMGMTARSIMLRGFRGLQDKLCTSTVQTIPMLKYPMNPN